MAQIKGENPPEININLPPRFLEEFTQTYSSFMDSITRNL
jgi:hypothetical protein